MDADIIERRRDQILSRRKSRWSMNSQRLEEIVAELMKPIGDLKRSFDTDLSALLEEYLTEAGLHALEEEEEGERGGGGERVPPNFAELAILLQQSASIYGRKVDFLYQNALLVSESLTNSTLELEAPADDSGFGEESPTGGRRRARAAAGVADFEHLELEAGRGAAREPEPPRPPPTLPRIYIELEPRVLHACDAPLLDYDDEPVGLLADFHVAGRLRAGLLVDELQGGERDAVRAPRPISLLELQAAIAAAAPAEPAPPPDPPAPPDLAPPPAPPPPPPPAPRADRKRRSDLAVDALAGGALKILVSDGLRGYLRRRREFRPEEAWIEAVVGERTASLLAVRRRLRIEATALSNGFRGFSGGAAAAPGGGFAGWSCAEAAAARGAAQHTSARVGGDLDSDDDGFFEQSSVGSSETSLEAAAGAGAGAGAGEERAWGAAGARRAGEAAAPDVRALAAAVLGACPAPPATCAWAGVLRAAGTHDADVSRLLLATLFLANAGNVQIVGGAEARTGAGAGAGAAPSMSEFSLRVLSRDARLYAAAAAEDAPR